VHAPPSFDKLFENHVELRPLAVQLGEAFSLLARSLDSGHVVYVCGNGGSAADAEHIVGELMKGMIRRRPLLSQDRGEFIARLPGGFESEADYLCDHLDRAFPAACLSSQSGLLTAISNDIGEDMGFAQQVYTYGRPGDVLWALSTSGRSRNVVLAALTADARLMPVLALTGHPGRPLGDLAAVWLRVPTSDVAIAQELHRPVYHALCQALEDELLPLDSERQGRPQGPVPSESE